MAFPRQRPFGARLRRGTHSGYFARARREARGGGACVESTTSWRRAGGRGGEPRTKSAGALEALWAALNLRGPFSVAWSSRP